MTQFYGYYYKIAIIGGIAFRRVESTASFPGHTVAPTTLIRHSRHNNNNNNAYNIKRLHTAYNVRYRILYYRAELNLNCL